jgi:MFS transporter, ACS family, allantoate permease
MQIKSFGYSSQLSLLLNVPEGIVAAITTLSVCYLADAKKRRMLPAFVALVPTIIGMVMLVGFSGNAAKYKAALLVGIMIVSIVDVLLYQIYGN